MTCDPPLVQPSPLSSSGVTITSTRASDRSTVNANGWPIASPSISRCSDWALVTASPLALTRMSRGCSPAFAAGPSDTTCSMRIPVF